MTLARRLVRLEAAATPGGGYGIVYEAEGRAVVYVTGSGATLTEEAWRARHPAGVVVKRLAGVSPHDL